MKTIPRWVFIVFAGPVAAVAVLGLTWVYAWLIDTWLPTVDPPLGYLFKWLGILASIVALGAGPAIGDTLYHGLEGGKGC